MDKIKEPTAHIWYAEQAAKNGWSRNVLSIRSRAAYISGRL